MMAPERKTVHLIELVELYLAPSTRVSGSTQGRILSRNIESRSQDIPRTAGICVIDSGTRIATGRQRLFSDTD